MLIGRYLYNMKFRIPRKLKKKLKKCKWIKGEKEVKPWLSQEVMDDYKSGNLEFTFWGAHSRYL